MTNDEIEVVAEVIKCSQDNFKSIRQHTEFAMVMAVHLAERTTIDEAGGAKLDKAKFILLCKPSWIVGTTKEKEWDNAQREMEASK